MGLIANQMIIEMCYKLGQKIQDKKLERQNDKKTDTAEKKKS